MLRIGFLPSDYNPMLLMLGEADDLRSLAGVLRRFAREQTDVRLDQLGFCDPTQTALTVTASPGVPGIEHVADNALLWRLNVEIANGFADQIDQLAACAAGSEFLECGPAEGIPVKVSRGEYTDDFLLAKIA